MTRMKAIAARISKGLVVQDGPALRPPGARVAWRHVERDGRELTVISRGDAIDIYYGRNSPVVFSITPRAALAFASFVLWRWWVRGTWCGFKLWLWDWSLRILMRPDEPQAPSVRVRESESAGGRGSPSSDAGRGSVLASEP